MNQEPQYFTVKLLEDYLIARHRAGGGVLNLREAVVQLRDEGLLLSEGKPEIWPDPEMDRETFHRVCSIFPWDATRILELPEQEYMEAFTKESTMFPPEQSVHCRRLLPYLYRDPLKLEYFEIYFVSSGTAQLSFEEDRFPLEEGDMVILPPYAEHGVTVEEGSFVVDIILRSSNLDSRFGELLTMSGVFSGFFREALYGSGQPNLLMLHTKPGDKTVDLCLRGLASECCRLDKHSWSTTTCWVKLLLSNALRSCGDKVEIYRFPTGGNPRADCGEILQYIQQNYRTVRLSTLARQFHYNETYLSRMLQNYAHQSFTEIVRDIRMNRAVEYLTNSSLRIHEIAGLVGYSSVDHFSRAFKAMYGVSPQNYRRDKRK